MKSTGITRKIDELGRIVIPKEIRKNLGIREGESLEIITSDDNILLKKHSQIGKYSELSNKICHIVSDVYNIKIIITDRDKVIGSNINVNNSMLNNKLKYLIDNRESFVGELSISFGNNTINGYFNIYPIIDESDSLGLVIINSKEKTDYILLCKMLIKIIMNLLT